MNARRSVIALLWLAVAGLAGCAAPADLHPTRPLITAASPPQTGAAVPWPATRWWTVFGDAQLDRLVDQALAGQPGLLAAQARLTQARAAVTVSEAVRGPQLTGAVDLTDQHFTGQGMIPAPLAGTTRWNNSAQLNASWELDLFGRQRSALEAAIGQWRASQAEVQAARMLLAAQVASAYVGLARLIDLRDVARQTLEQREQILTLVRQRTRAGLDNEVDLRQAEGLIAQSRVELEAAAESIVRARHALAELSGQAPQALEALSPALGQVRPVAVPQDLPADLLGRRADLVAQRWRVEAALHEVDAARAQFHPNVNLVAFAGLASLGLDRLVDTGSRQYGAGPALRLPIFDGGRLRAQLGARSAEADAAIDGYNGTLLRALREVADELGSLQSLERQQRLQDEAGALTLAACDLALQRYRAGLGNFLVVLTAQTQVLAQQRAAADLKARRLGSEIALSRALGGGFEARPDDLHTPLTNAIHPSTTP